MALHRSEHLFRVTPEVSGAGSLVGVGRGLMGFLACR